MTTPPPSQVSPVATTATAVRQPPPLVDHAMVESVTSLSPLEASRLAWQPTLPTVLRGENLRAVRGVATTADSDPTTIQRLFPHLYGQHTTQLVSGASDSTANADSASAEENHPIPSTPQRIGILLSGGPASGGHNVISGLFDFLTQRTHADSRLIGFLDGPSGLIDGKFVEVTKPLVDKFRNQGGFHMLGSSRTKIETEAQFRSVADVCTKLHLDGLVITGGDDSNTNAALLAEYFARTGHPTRCVGVPKTIDGDLRNEYIEASFGFDTATKSFSETCAALCADAASAKKTYHFVRLMGRTASHITLEVALQTHPNVTLIGEEILAKGQTLRSIIKEIADVIATRALQGRHYGCIILPEGLVDFLPDVAKLIGELNELLAAAGSLGLPANVTAHLSNASATLFHSLPAAISEQLLLDRDPHGNVQVSKIESERLVAALVEKELARRKRLGTYRGSPSFVCHFLGYQGRCGLPSDFDATYCYALGQTAGALLTTGHTGMIATIQGLAGAPAAWQCGGMPLTHLMCVERRHGKDKPVIRKALVRLDARPFLIFEQLREGWKYQDAYRNPGPIQYAAPWNEHVTLTLALEQRHAPEHEHDDKHDAASKMVLQQKQDNAKSASIKAKL